MTFNSHVSIFAADDELVFLTDFDGTLAEIKPNPVNTRMTAETKHLVHKLATHPNIYLAVISGRRVSDVHERVGLDNITYSGNHGLEIIFSNGTEYHYPMPPEVYKNCSLLRDEIQQKLAKNGAWLEDKNVSLTYHYGQVPDELKEKYLTQVRQLIHEYGYILVQAHLGIEIKPPVVWSKGTSTKFETETTEVNLIHFVDLYALGAAAKLILQEVLGNAWTTKKIKVIFAGDDNSDEDVMRVSQTLFGINNFYFCWISILKIKLFCCCRR